MRGSDKETKNAIKHIQIQIDRAGLFVLRDAGWIMTTADLIERYFGKESHHYEVFVNWQSQPRNFFENEQEKTSYFDWKKIIVIRILNNCIQHLERFGVRKGRIVPAIKDWQTICAILTVLIFIGAYIFDLGGKIKNIEITKEQYARDRQLDSFKTASRFKPTPIDTTNKKTKNQKAPRIPGKPK